MMVNQTTLLTLDYNYRDVHVLTAFCSHFLTVNNHRYGRCYVKKIMPLCTYLEFYRQIQRDHFKMLLQVFKGFKYYALKNRNCDECRHFKSIESP